jgi:hypothetical protein
MTDIDIDKLFEAARRLPPLTGKVVISPPPNAEAQSEDQADAMVAAMIASWKRSIDEVDRLRAENQRLRAIEAAAREVAANVEDDSDSLLGCVVVQPSREEWLALKAALAAKDML